MSEFLKHDVCPRCLELGKDRNRDNLGVWSDHVYCFSCGYSRSSNPLNLNVFYKKKKEKNNDSSICLPDDCSPILPDFALDWLKSYGITDAEIDETFYWSPSLSRLIMAIKDDNQNLTMWTGRAFNGKKPKWYHEGDVSKIYKFFGKPSCAIIVVEDPISALKVGRQYQTMPLFGAYMAPERIITLAERFSELWIWLDKDKAKESLKTRLKASPYFNVVKSIVTDKDPKSYSNEQIQTLLF